MQTGIGRRYIQFIGGNKLRLKANEVLSSPGKNKLLLDGKKCRKRAAPHCYVIIRVSLQVR